MAGKRGKLQPEDNNPDLANALKKSGVETDNGEPVDTAPLFQMLGDSKIPVSKNMGSLWQARIKQGQTARADVEECWSEAIRYYEHDQLKHRTAGKDGRSGNTRFQRRIGESWSETENVVFSNVTTMLPMLYAKNPAVAITPINTEANMEYAKTCQALLNAILSMTTEPGINLKPKAKRGILWTLLTNSAYAKPGYTLKANSSETALEELQKISEEYSKDDLKQCDIKELEGQLMALEEKVSILSPSGPTLKLVSPFRLVIDPTSIEPDHTDAQWIAEMDFLQTDYLNAVYAKEDGKDREVSIYEPTHVLNGGDSGDNGIQDEVNNFSLFKKDADMEAKNYGFQTMAQFKAASYTKVWWIWDKTTRRVFLYVDGKWKWPLWVWDDPLKLLEFFPYTHLWFHETVEGSQPKGEVTYYLDQQDAINDINSDMARARRWARMNVFFDKNKVSQTDVESVLSGPDGTARGLDIPEGMKITDCIFSLVPPSMSHPEVFQNQMDSKFQSINRITGINDAQRGAQFKTNTTNDAVDFYQKNVEIRTDEKIDAIEDWIGMIAWKLLQLCARNMSKEDVAAIIGNELAQAWVQITDPQDLRTKLNVKIVGGSTDKPTSKNKKQAAMQIAQALGQFSSGIPAVGMIALKVVERAFQDDVNLTEEDWSSVSQSMNDNMNKAGAGAQGAPGGPPQGDPSAQQGQQEASPEDAAKIQQLIASLPPQAKQELAVLVKHGVPPMVALQKVTGAGQQQQQAAPGPAPQPAQ